MSLSGFTTFEGIILRVATEVGLHYVPRASEGSNAPQIPRDKNVLDRLKRAINDGRREIMRRMSNAKCFRPRMTLTLSNVLAPENIDDDTAKITLPFVAIPTGRWTWSKDAVWGGELTLVHETDIAFQYAARDSAVGASVPMKMAFCQRLINNPDAPGQRTQMYLWAWPRPDGVYVLSGNVIIRYADLTALSDLDPMGDAHIPTVVAAALRELNLNNPSPQMREMFEQRLDKAIAVSMQFDDETRPPSIGVSYDPDAQSVMVRDPSQWGDRSNQVTHYNNVPLL